MRESLSRRRFLRRGAQAAAILGLPAISSLRGLGSGAWAASDRVGVAHVGVGGRGTSLMGWTRGIAGLGIVAVCDVDRQHLAAAKAAAGSEVEAVDDYRRLLDRKDIEGFVVATPDHWHALIAVEAMQAGKDVYVEKPLSTTIGEGRAIVAAARKHGKIVQVGIHHRSEAYIRSIVEIIRGGRIGPVREVKCWMWTNPVEEPTPGEPVPAELDWDRWLGPAPFVPYHPKRAHYNFRWCRDYAGGYMTDWGVHMLNVVTYAMDVDAKGPTVIEASGRYAERNIYDFPASMQARFEFHDPDFVLSWIQPSEGGDILPGERYGMTFYGEDGELRTGFGSHKFYREGKEAPLPREGKPVDVVVSPGHMQDWLDCIRSRKAPIAESEIGHRTTSLCILGNIALWTGRRLRWDGLAERFIDDAEATRYVSREARAPWGRGIIG